MALAAPNSLGFVAFSSDSQVIIFPSENRAWSEPLAEWDTASTSDGQLSIMQC
jgi:hypothetical protein